MVLEFFRRGESGMEQVTTKVIGMLADARHSFDLATAAVLGGVDPETVSHELHSTDDRINRTEQELRRDLVVHVSVQGAMDIGDVMGYILLIKKIERIGDQAKNIWDLAAEGVDLSGAEDLDKFVPVHQEISNMLDELAGLLAEEDEAKVAEYRARADQLRDEQELLIREMMHSTEPGHWAVPRAILHRYLKRIIANLAGVASSIVEPVQVDELDLIDDIDD